MQSNRNLVRSFACGANSGKSANMEIRNNLLIGYGHAIYAKRTKNHTIKVYSGWIGRSRSTTDHVRLILRYAQTTSQTRKELP